MTKPNRFSLKYSDYSRGGALIVIIGLISLVASVVVYVKDSSEADEIASSVVDTLETDSDKIIVANDETVELYKSQMPTKIGYLQSVAIADGVITSLMIDNITYHPLKLEVISNPPYSNYDTLSEQLGQIPIEYTYYQGELNIYHDEGYDGFMKYIEPILDSSKHANN